MNYILYACDRVGYNIQGILHCFLWAFPIQWLEMGEKYKQYCGIKVWGCVTANSKSIPVGMKMLADSSGFDPGPANTKYYPPPHEFIFALVSCSN